MLIVFLNNIISNKVMCSILLPKIKYKFEYHITQNFIMKLGK